MDNNLQSRKYIDNLPTSLPSVISWLNKPITLWEIAVVCCDEEYAKEQAERMEHEIAFRLEMAIMTGASTSKSDYQNVRLDGKHLTYEYYRDISSLFHDEYTPSSEPLARYNQYEIPKLESVTFRLTLANGADNRIEISRAYLQICLDNNEIDSFSIDGNTISITSHGINPFGKVVNATCGMSNRWNNKENLTPSALDIHNENIDSTIKTTMLTLAVIIFIAMILSWIFGN